MKKRFNKKGEIVLSTVIFIVLNLIFFSMLIFFVLRASTGVGVYEQVDAKQIALLIDAAKPGMELRLDLAKEREMAVKNKQNPDNIVEIDNSEKKVIVSLASGKGYSYNYFMNYKVETEFEEDVLVMNVFEGEDSEEIYVKESEIGKRSKEQIEFVIKNVDGCVCGVDCADYAKYLFEAAGNDLDVLLLLSIMVQESNCRAGAVSNVGCIGLMQICSWQMCKDKFGLTEENWKQVLSDPEKNIKCGADILRSKYNSFKRGLVFTGCSKTAYYSGWHAAVRGYVGWGCAKGHDNYVEKVMERHDKFVKCLGDIRKCTD